MLIFNREIIYRYRYLLLYIGGVLVGTLIINMFYESRVAQIVSYGRYVFGRAENEYAKADFIRIFLETFIKRLKEFGILIIFAYTMFAGIYSMYYIFSKGLSVGITISLSVMCYGAKGILLVLLSVAIYIVPYVILLLMALNYVEDVKKSGRFKSVPGGRSIGGAIAGAAPLARLAVLLIIEAAAESVFLF